MFRSLTICLRFRLVTLPESWKIVDDITKITASGHEKMRDGGQDFEVMINKVPGARFVRSSSLCAAHGGIVAQCARVTTIDQQPSLLLVSRVHAAIFGSLSFQLQGC